MTLEKLDDMNERLANLGALLPDARAFAQSRSITSNEGRTLALMYVRLLETLVEGKPSTELPPRHHA